MSDNRERGVKPRALHPLNYLDLKFGFEINGAVRDNFLSKILFPDTKRKLLMGNFYDVKLFEFIEMLIFKGFSGVLSPPKAAILNYDIIMIGGYCIIMWMIKLDLLSAS